jgi:DNA ligase-1
MFISPMLLETSESAFDSPDFIFEPKIDGHRLILVRRNGITKLFTRHRTDCTQQYLELHSIALDDVILDGEVACTDPATGKIDFESVMQRFQTRKAEKIQRLIETRPVNFVVFDVLRLNSIDLRGMQLMKRKEILARLDFRNDCITKIPFIETDGSRLFVEICSRQMEGIVAKRKESVYANGRRSAAWKKIINWSYAEGVIIGYRRKEFGWLVAVETEIGGLRPAGIIELGVTATPRRAFEGVVRTMLTGTNGEFVFVKPRIRVKVKFRNWTKSGMLRDPVFIDFIM